MLNRHHFAHIGLNLAGIVAPMAAGIAVVPGLLERLGQERFGALALAWALVGYFGWLDLGLGRALTQYLSQQEAQGLARPHQAATARTARRTMLGIGLAWTALLLAAPSLLGRTLRLPDSLRDEAQLGWALLALAVPLLTWTNCSIGALEARSRFGAVNGVRVPAGVLMFGVPWLVTLYTNDLRAVIAGLLVVRLAAALVYAWIARSEFTPGVPAAAGHAHGLLRFGSWLTVTNLVGPLLTYFDRFAIAATLSMAAVTHYTVPFDALTRLPALPIAMMGVLFPLLAHAHGLRSQAPAQLVRLLDAAARLLVAVWLPALALAVLLGPWFLHAWLGAELAQPSIAVWGWLAVGVAVNGFAHIPYTLLQSAGRTDLVGKLHLCETLPYALALWWALPRWGIVGAAVVWSLRVVVDTALLYTCAAQRLPATAASLRKGAIWALGSGMTLMLLGPMGLAHWAGANEGTPPTATLATVGAAALAWCGFHLSRLRSTA